MSQSGDQLDEFVRDLHPSTTLLSRGTATVLGHNVPAALTRNLYGQEIVWGVFNCDRGKFKGKRLTNNAATDAVHYSNDEGLCVVDPTSVYPEADSIPPMNWPNTDHLSDIVKSAILAQMRVQK